LKRAGVNMVEIDLLRGGERVLLLKKIIPQYRAT
jgi:hypothetical protein